MSSLPLVRLPDWRSRLSACVEGALQRPFEWGQHDCMLFPADAVLAMTGVDPAKEWRGRYSTRIGAARILRKVIAAGDGSAVVRSILPEIAPLLASDGDIAAVEQDGLRIMGVIIGPMFASPGPDVLAFVSRDEVVVAFHLPFEGEVA